MDATVEINKQNTIPVTYGEWQLCPKCLGNGYIAKHIKITTAGMYSNVCDVCQGAKILSRPIIKS